MVCFTAGIFSTSFSHLKVIKETSDSDSNPIYQQKPPERSNIKNHINSEYPYVSLVCCSELVFFYCPAFRKSTTKRFTAPKFSNFRPLAVKFGEFCLFKPHTDGIRDMGNYSCIVTEAMAFPDSDTLATITFPGRKGIRDSSYIQRDFCISFRVQL